jgi:CRISPR-associated endonuclease/helicase Cas3
VEVVLLHSRFRPPERERGLTRALAEDFAGVIVSTQVIEAGVDLSAKTLFTELAPWPSLVQRAGRCNREGLYDEAAVFWIDHQDEVKPAPYAEEDLKEARECLLRLTSFNPEAIAGAGVRLKPPPAAHVLRRRDVRDLFDTTPDLGGLDIDVSRFIREDEERDAQVFWRRVEVPRPEMPRPHRDELCTVPFTDLIKHVQSGRRAFRWDPLDREWRPVPPDRIVPGGVYLLLCAEGGYDPARGFSSASGAPVDEVPSPRPERTPEEGLDDDPWSELHAPVALAIHSADARGEAERIVRDLDLQDLPADVVVRAAQAHDLGKAHEVFQETMRKAALPAGTQWAKSGKRGLRHSRSGFRHELASALAWLQAGPEPDRDLIAYLLAAHHGKVRLSIRALPADAPPDDGRDRRHARGIWDGDPLPEADLGEGLHFPAVCLSLQPMELGRTDSGPSWSERVLHLRDRLGPFRLAYLEALVRAADVCASIRRDTAMAAREQEADR